MGATGDDHLFAAYVASDAPSAISSFYVAQLPVLGWVLESNQQVVSDRADDGSQHESTVLTFVKETERLTVSIASYKGSILETAYNFDIRPR